MVYIYLKPYGVAKGLIAIWIEHLKTALDKSNIHNQKINKRIKTEQSGDNYRSGRPIVAPALVNQPITTSLTLGCDDKKAEAGEKCGRKS